MNNLPKELPRNPIAARALPAINNLAVEHERLAYPAGTQRFSVDFHHMDQVLILSDLTWHVTACSRGAESLLGIKECDLQGKLITDLFGQGGSLQSFGPESFPGREHFLEDVRLPNGKNYTLILSYNAICDERGIKSYLFWIINITELARSRAEAMQASSAKSQFLAHMSHEIRTPLLGILGFCERLGREPLLEKQQESVETIEDCANQLLNLVNDLLDLSRIEAERVELNRYPFNLRSLIKQTLLPINPDLKKKRLHLDWDIDSTLPEYLLGDELKIRQVLSNLLINAIKYTDQGTIKVSISLEKPDLKYHTTALSTRFSVADSGIGVEVDKADKIFEPFVQVDNVRKGHGNGLGLAICKQLVEAMGGRIWCQPNQPGGSVFSFTLPLDEGVVAQQIIEAETAYPDSRSQSRLASSPTILLAEDIKVNRKLIQYLLEDAGCKVFTVENGEKCLALLEQAAPDIILMDMQMPVLNGFETTSIIRQLPAWQKIPIVALTAYAMQGDVDKCMKVGCTYYLSKPFTRNQLYRVLEQCLNNSDQGR